MLFQTVASRPVEKGLTRFWSGLGNFRRVEGLVETARSVLGFTPLSAGLAPA